MRKLAIAYGNSRHAKKWVNKQITFDELKDRLKTPIRTTESAEEYAKFSKAQKDDAKDHGGFVAGVLKGGRRKIDTVELRSMIALDGDRIDKEFLENYESNAQYTSVLYSTHSSTEENPSTEDWEKVQELMERRKKKRKIGAGGVEKYKNRYPLSGMLICPHCGKTLRRKQVYNKRIEWWCSTYITKGKSTCKGIKIADEIASKKNITEQTVIEEVMIDGEKYYSYTSKADYDRGIRNEPDASATENGSVLPRVNRQRRTAIKL